MNTGLHISDNGRRLAELLDRLDGCWPVPVEEILLVGHSMGGLINRSACHYGMEDGHAVGRAGAQRRDAGGAPPGRAAGAGRGARSAWR